MDRAHDRLALGCFLLQHRDNVVRHERVKARGGLIAEHQRWIGEQLKAFL